MKKDVINQFNQRVIEGTVQDLILVTKKAVLDVNEAAKAANCSVKKIRNAIKDRELKAKTSGGKYQITVRNLAIWLNEN